MAIIPYEHKTYVEKLRKFLGDEAVLNKLLEVEECDDQFLYQTILDALDRVNYEFSPETDWSLDNMATGLKSWVTLRTGAVLEVLIGKGILSARSTLTYNDASNITCQDMDQYGRYINFFNLLVNKFIRGVIIIKTRKNIDDCWGGIDSAFSY